MFHSQKMMTSLWHTVAKKAFCDRCFVHAQEQLPKQEGSESFAYVNPECEWEKETSWPTAYPHHHTTHWWVAKYSSTLFRLFLHFFSLSPHGLPTPTPLLLLHSTLTLLCIDYWCHTHFRTTFESASSSLSVSAEIVAVCWFSNIRWFKFKTPQFPPLRAGSHQGRFWHGPRCKWSIIHECSRWWISAGISADQRGWCRKKMCATSFPIQVYLHRRI